MPLGQIDIFGKNKVDVAIDRAKAFEPEEGYHFCYSGGKDSIATEIILKLADVKFKKENAHVTVDPPELVNFVRNQPDVNINYPEETMWQLIERKLMPPTRMVRYCCCELKENTGEGRFLVTGVRWAESSKRKNTRNAIEFDTFGSQSKKAKENREIFLLSDNDKKRKMLDTCVIKGKHCLNPIIDFEDDEVWELINYYNAPYPELYDEGFERLGCIGCPLSKKCNREREFKRWPKYKENYIRAFDRMLKKKN